LEARLDTSEAVRSEFEPASSQNEPNTKTASCGTEREGKNAMITSRCRNVGEGKHAAATRACGRLAGVLTLVMGGAVAHRAVAQDPPPLPVVTIVATDPDASEIGPDPGRFTFTRARDGDLTGSLTVMFVVSGTATKGEDYESIADTVVFDDGASTATLIISPINDESEEGMEDVTLVLQENESYRRGAETSATVRIQDAAGVPVACQIPDPEGECRNQWLIDGYLAMCGVTEELCRGFFDTVESLGDACYEACTRATDAAQRICGWAVDNACTLDDKGESLYRLACKNIGLGTGCNITYAGCMLGRWGTCRDRCQTSGDCLFRWGLSKRCLDCKSHCRDALASTCQANRRSCIDAFDCEKLPFPEPFCGTDCDNLLNAECDRCRPDLPECDLHCAETAPECRTAKHLGEACVILPVECEQGLVCRPDQTNLEGFGPGAFIEALLESSNVKEFLEKMKENASASSGGGVDLTPCFTDSDGCVCRQPLLEGVGEELDEKACMALYRPGRHLQAWLVNDAIAGTNSLRDKIIQQLKDAGAPDSLVDALSNRFQEIAFTYGMGASAEAGLSLSGEVGTVYGKDCYGCYYTVCGGVAPALGVGVSGTTAVSDATGDNGKPNGIENLGGWDRYLSISAEIPVINVGVEASFAFAPDIELPEPPPPGDGQMKDFFLGGGLVRQAIDAFNTQIQDILYTIQQDTSGEDKIDLLVKGLLKRFVPTGRGVGLNAGLGVDPIVTPARGLCYTWIRPSICLRTDGGSNPDRIQCQGPPSLGEQPSPPGSPVLQAICRDRTIFAAALPACNASTNIDDGSFDPAGGALTLTQSPPGPYDLVGVDGIGDDGVGVHNVTLTAADASNSATCTATVTVEDRSRPELTCPVDATYECQGNYQAVIDPGDATAADCSSFTKTDPGSASYPLGTTTVTYSATDVRGNSASCTTAVTVADRLEPSITCPEGISITSAPGQCAYTETFTVITSDLCDPSPVVACVDQYGGSVDPAGHSYPVGITNVTCTSTDSSGNSQSDAFAVEVNDPPQVTAVSATSQTVQYSDRIVPVTITATDCGPGPLTISHAGVPNGLTLPTEAAACYSTGGPVACLFTLEGTALVPEGDYPIEVTIWDEKMLASVTTSIITIQVKAEDATVAFDGGNPVAVQVATAGGSSGLFVLSVDVRELVPDLASTGAALPGDIRKAVLSMTLAPVGPGGPVVGTCAPDNAGALSGFDYSEVLTFTCAFDGVPVNTYTVEAVLVANAEGLYYTGSNEDVLVVFDPSLGFTTGGGRFYWPGTTDCTNFGYTMKYNRKWTSIQGSLLLIRRLPDGSIYRVKSNALYGLALGDISGSGWASFAGKGTFQDPSMIEPVGNHEFVTYVEDLDEPGAGMDRFWLQVFDRDGLLIGNLSMDETAVDNAIVIAGGNIVVPHTDSRTSSR